MTRQERINAAPKAWDYPPRGGSVLTCGCWQPFPHSAREYISYWDWDDGQLCEFSGYAACPFHAIRIKTSGAHIETWVPSELEAA